MSQPNWECIGQLGDVNPVEHGGYWVLRDTTGVYPEEAEKLFVPEEGEKVYVVRRVILERCTFVNGILSDNQFHPEHSAWFATPESKRAKRPQDTTYLKNVADFCGTSEAELIRMFCSENALERARAYEAVGDYHGWDNFDDYPLELSKFETVNRYRQKQFRLTPAE